MRKIYSNKNYKSIGKTQLSEQITAALNQYQTGRPTKTPELALAMSVARPGQYFFLQTGETVDNVRSLARSRNDRRFVVDLTKAEKGWVKVCVNKA